MTYFGASTGAAAALYAASCFKDLQGVVYRGGRTDLVDKETLESITSPCLFIFGGIDKKVLQIDKKTINYLIHTKAKQLEVVKDASHLFEE